jgi:hypothetical protein
MELLAKLGNTTGRNAELSAHVQRAFTGHQITDDSSLAIADC